MAANLEMVRNIGIIAHIDAGKTTTTERILFYTGKQHRMGEVHEGTATMDWMAEERERGITITAAATTTWWRGYRINLIDTPGHVDFTAEVERSLRVLDGAIGVFCGVAGVEAQSYSVWRRADRYRIPRLAYINKLDRAGADFERVVDDIEHSLKTSPIVVTFPLYEGGELAGVVDVIGRRALEFSEQDQGKTVRERPLTEEAEIKLGLWYERLVDRLSAVDDAFLERALAPGGPGPEEIRAALRRATLACRVTPVYAGSSLRNKGVQPLLDGVVELLPSPLDAGAIEAIRAEGKKAGEKVLRRPDPGEPLCALAFKTQVTSFGELTWLRVYSGTLTSGAQVYNPRAQKKERLGQLWLMHADAREKIESAGPGEIVAAVGLKYTVTGDTLCPTHQPVTVEPMDFPETVISMAIEPRTSAERDKLLEVLGRLQREDPTFAVREDEETGQTIISGMGELHLEVLAHRIKREFGVDARVGKPRVSYRQTVAQPAEGYGRFERETGQRRLFGAVRLRVAPWSPPAGSKQKVRFTSRLPSGRLPRELEAAVAEGALSAAAAGGTLGYPIIDVEIELLDAELHPTDSTEVAFNAAAAMAFQAACEKAGLVMLEPVMRLEIQTPEEYYGAVLTDLQQRRATLQDMAMHGEMRVIRGVVPLAEMFGYSTTIRSLSQGRATFSLEPYAFAPVPEEARPRWV
ncbi:MAG: elongation factor G [Planctomycetota bacterium]|nr:MAG: elongation factor G [Planctomycetota bacterium]